MLDRKLFLMGLGQNEGRAASWARGARAAPRVQAAPPCSSTPRLRVCKSLPCVPPWPRVPTPRAIPTSIPSEFPRIDISGRALGQDEMDVAIQTTSTSKVRRVDFGDCGPAI